MTLNSKIQIAIRLLERRLLPGNHPEKLSQAALERELAILEGDRTQGPRRYWRAGIELSAPQEREQTET